jgi:hypothetical protein
MEFLDDEAIERLAKKITEKYYAFDKGALKRWGSEGKEKTVYSTKKTLQRLRTCVELDDIERFCSYMEWLTAVMTSRKIKFNVIFDHTEICYKTIKSEWSKEKNKSKKNSAAKYVHFMKVGLEHLKNNAPISKKDSIVGV